MQTKYAKNHLQGKHPPRPGNIACAVYCSSLLFLVLFGTARAEAPTVELEPEPGQAVATLAAGCFWCIEADLEKIPGVITVVSGYSGGHKKNPSYKDVSAGGSGHREVVRLIYDPEQLSYEKLLRVFWRNIDPTDGKGQFCDRGFQYSSAIYYHNEEQKDAAQTSLNALRSQRPDLGEFHTGLQAAAPFYPAEARHQDYYKENPLRYHFYRFRCGRDQRLEQLWGPPPEASPQQDS